MLKQMVSKYLKVGIGVRVRPTSRRRFVRFRDAGVQPTLERGTGQFEGRTANVVEDMAGSRAVVSTISPPDLATGGRTGILTAFRIEVFQRLRKYPYRRPYTYKTYRNS